MSTPTFGDTHNLVAILEKPAESAEFKQIIDFLKSKPIHYALTMNPTIYVSCVKQFWATAKATVKVQRVNDQEHKQTLVDKKKVIIMEDSIRSDLRFDDVDGTACLLNEEIFKGLARRDNQVKGMARHKEMYVISSHTKKIFANIRRIRAGFSGVVTPLFDTMTVQVAADMGDTPVETHQPPIIDQPSTSRPQKKQKPRRKQRKEAEVAPDESEDEDHVSTPSSDPLPNGRRAKSPLEKDSLGAQEDASKQGRMIEEIDQDDEIALDADTQGRKNNDEMFGVDDLSRDEVVTTVADKVNVAPTTNVTEDKITMAQALAVLKSVKPIIPAVAIKVTTVVPTPRSKGIVFHEQKQSPIPIISSSKDKGNAKMIEAEVPIKKKDQMRMDEKYARQLEAEEQEAARLIRAQQDEEDNISWDNTQAMMEADNLLAERL
nr:hypothetical protein [Tanacetum cinerariifolium]